MNEKFKTMVLQEEKKRIVWVDVLKGILLIFICISHFDYVLPVLKPIIIQTASYWVPIFFILSGYLFVMKENDTMIGYIKKKSQSLLLPYLFFCILFIILDPNTYIITDGYLERNIKRMLFCGSGVEKASPLWFVLSLYFSSILAFFILHVGKSFSMLIVAVVATFVLAQSPLEADAACMWIIAFSAVVLVVSGYYLKCFFVRFGVWNVVFKFMIVGIVLIVGTCGMWGENLGDFHLNVITNYPPPVAVCITSLPCILFNSGIFRH